MTEALRHEWSATGKAALVTGAGSGIGFEFAKILVEKGCNVVIADLALRPEAQDLVDTTAGKKPCAIFQTTDVSEWSQLSNAVAVCVAQFGRIDLACPGAGIYEPPWSNFWKPPGSEGSVDTLESNGYRTLDVNLTHPIRLTQLIVQHYLAHQVPGRVIHISSIAAQGAGPLTPIYNATKAAVSQFVRSLASLEAAFGIRVVGVAPGVVRTPLWTDPQHRDKIRYVDEAKDTWVTPREVAEAMLRLLDDENLPGGTILEVGAGSTRKVTTFNDPGPSASGPGLSVSNAKATWEEFADGLRHGGMGV